MSRFIQSDLILVKNFPLPDFRKKPIAGSSTTEFNGIGVFLTIDKLSLSRFFVATTVFPETIFLPYAHKIKEGQNL